MAKRKSFDVVSFIAASQVATLGGASEWSPSDVSGLFAWYDFSDVTMLYQDAAKTTPVTANNDLIGACVDKSGNGRDLTQTTDIRRPVYVTNQKNSLSISRYDSAGDVDCMGGAYPLPATISLFAITKMSLVAIMMVVDGRDANDDGMRLLTSSGLMYFSVDATDISDSTDTTNYYLYTCIYNGTNAYLRENATAKADSAATLAGTTTNVSIGKNAYDDNGALTGDIGEILIYNTAVSDADRDTIEAFLIAKWGIS